MCEGGKDRSEQQDGDGDGKTGGEEDAEENGSCKGRTRWSQVVARVRLAGGARLAAQKRFPPPIHATFGAISDL